MTYKHKKMCSTLLVVGKNLNQHYNEVSPHTSPNDHHQKKKKNLQTVNTGEDVKKREPSCTVGGNIFVTAIIENRMEIS